MSPKQHQTHIDTHSTSILLELYSRDYESAGKTRLSFAVALAIFTHTETPPLKHTLKQTQSHTDRKMNKSASYHLLFFSIYETAGGKMHFVAAAVKAFTTGLQYLWTAECNDWGLCYNSNSLLAEMSTNKNKKKAEATV